jgi:hypothetical protein
MTPKEKAKELYLKMLNWQTDSNKFLETNIISTSAKQCALIVVDEIRDNLPLITDIQNYWQQVKQEIQAL